MRHCNWSSRLSSTFIHFAVVRAYRNAGFHVSVDRFMNFNISMGSCLAIFSSCVLRDDVAHRIQISSRVSVSSLTGSKSTTILLLTVCIFLRAAIPAATVVVMWLYCSSTTSMYECFLFASTLSRGLTDIYIRDISPGCPFCKRPRTYL